MSDLAPVFAGAFSFSPLAQLPSEYRLGTLSALPGCAGTFSPTGAACPRIWHAPYVLRGLP